jgi:protein TonB
MAVLGLLMVPQRLAPPPPTQRMIITLEGIVEDTQSLKKDDLGEQHADEVAPAVSPPATPEQQPAVTDVQPAPADRQPPEPRDQPEKKDDQAPPAPPPPPRPAVQRPPADKPAPPQPTAPSRPASTAQRAVSGAKERDQARRLLTKEELSKAKLQEYVKLLSRRIEANLFYPDAARQAGLDGTTTVSFSILADGRIDPASLRVVAPSGHPALDDGALKTVLASVPFDPPPQQPMTISIGIVFSRKS